MGFALAFSLLCCRPVVAQEVSAADRAFAASVTSTIPHYQSLSEIDQVRALRRYVYRRVPLAADQSSMGDVSDPSLAEAFAGLERRQQGVWCGGAAILLSRLYQAAGFDSWFYDFGRANMLTHITTLVRVKDHIYLQDGYLDFEQDDPSGAPIDFFRGLQDTRRGHPPKIKALVEPRVGYFQTLTEAESWAGQDVSESCTPVSRVVRCVFPVSLPRFLDIFFLMPQTYDFLKSQGWPADVAYLFLYPSRVESTGPLGRGEATTLLQRAQALAGAASKQERRQQVSSTIPANAVNSAIPALLGLLGAGLSIAAAILLWRRRQGGTAVLPIFEGTSPSFPSLGGEETAGSRAEPASGPGQGA